MAAPGRRLLLNGALHFGLNFMALRQAGDISSVAIAMQSYVPMSALLAVWLLGERIGWRTAVGIGIAFGGVLVLGFDPLVLDAPAALAATLVAALSLALGTVLMRGLRSVGPFIIRQLITHMMEDPRTITTSIEIISIARAIERIGDHAKNVAEQVVFIVEGRDIRHINEKAQ